MGQAVAGRLMAAAAAIGIGALIWALRHELGPVFEWTAETLYPAAPIFSEIEAEVTNALD